MPVEEHPEATLVRRPGDATLSGAAGAVQHALVVPNPDGPPIRVPLGVLAVAIGRTPPADVVIAQPEISRRHAEVALVDGRAVVRDLGSTNGTYVDGRRIDAATPLAPGSGFRVGNVVIEYEVRAARAAAEDAGLQADIARAGAYVAAIQPQPLRAGPVLAEHYYLPCARLGGDAFGYQQLSDGVFAGYVLDVTGHGAAAAMHAVSIANILRQPGLLGADLARPAEVASRLNAAFPMERQGGMLFTLWYWSYDAAERVLEYCSAGHHPALLLAPGSAALATLDRTHPQIGMLDGVAYAPTRLKLRLGCRLYLVSDGAFELQTADGSAWGQADIAELVRAAPPDDAVRGEPERIFAAVRAAARPGPLDDDFCALAFGFP